jgi:hypothetical protein
MYRALAAFAAVLALLAAPAEARAEATELRVA